MKGERPTMCAARYLGPGAGLSLETIPVPEAGPGEALVRVQAAGLCHTELQFLAGTLNLGVAPLTLGHEVAGEVASLGGPARERPTAADPALSIGDRVVVYYYAPCDECEWCSAGQEQICPNMGPQIGFSGDGGFAEFVRVPTKNLLPIPDGVDVAAAATLGCSAAAAVHAVRAVAEPRAGETVIVYGVGAVGLALVQMARLAGARVLAVGRSPAKLALAREVGADLVLNAREQDVVAETQRATRSEGADVVFEVVASSETMANSVAMLRRRGRLVFVGYGEDRLSLNPLHLVLKELQVRGSLGNTRAELRETLALAAAGKLRSVISGCRPLEDVNEALEALRRGEVVGRIVLQPSVVATCESTKRSDRAAAAHVGAQFIAPVPVEGAMNCAPTSEQASSTGEVGLTRLVHQRQRPQPTSEQASSTGEMVRPLEAELLAFIGRGVDGPKDDAEFNALALRLFAYQLEHNQPYLAFCSRRGRNTENVAHWREIPPVPIAGFKEAQLTCEPTEGAREFNSSGTTQPEKKSRHFHPSLAVYDLNAALNFQAHLLPDGAQLPILVLFPPPDQMPNSSLAHWLALMARRFGAGPGRWLVGPDGLDADGLVAALREAERSGQPICLLAASFALVHFLDYCAEAGLRFALPRGSRLMDTGGYKGRSRELLKEELYGLACKRLGLDDDELVNMYGMTEHSTQFLDAVLRNRVRGIQAPRYKTVPPWARTLVVDPDSLEPVAPGELGLLCHFDLANRASVLAVLSEDVGYEVGDGFELVGRAEGTEARGCSIAVDELISATRG